jgi:hypothetical protein
MSGRGWLIVLVLVVGIGWWFSPAGPHTPAAPAAATGTTVACVLPLRVEAFEPPRQTSVPSSLMPFRLEAATLTPLAGFSVDARVLSRKDYGSGREADLSPTDLALGWGAMRSEAILSRLEISQSGRWYHYRWSGDAPLPPAEIVRSSANMHMIPANAAVAEALDDVRQGERVRIDGWLVEAATSDGWRWRSSTSRTDTGSGACEVVYVCALTRL